MRKFISPLLTYFLLVFVALFAFGATAFAADAVTPSDGSLLDMLSPVIDAFKGGHYVYAGALALVLAVAAAKRYGGERFPSWNGDIGGTVLALLGSFFATLATTLGTNGTFGVGMLYTSLTVAVAAAGGYTIIKKLVMDPLLKSSWYTTKAPAWFKAGLSIVTWIFESPTPIATAEAAGTAAVAAKPAEGVAAVSGKPTELK